MADGDHATVLGTDDFVTDEIEDQTEDEGLYDPVGDNLADVQNVQPTPPRSSIKSDAETIEEQPLQEGVAYGSTSNFFDTDDVPSDHGSQYSGGSSKGSLSSLKPEGNDGEDAQDGDDEYSETGESRRDMTADQSLWDELDLMKKEDEEDEKEEEEEDEEEEEVDWEDWRHRKKLYHFTKFKQDKLISNYMQSIETLKVARKKNMYLQDRIFKHLREKERVLNQCHEAVKERKEKAFIQHQSEQDFKGSRKQEAELDSEVCDPYPAEEEDNEEASPEKNSQAEALYAAQMSNYKQENKQRKKCERAIRHKKGKGPSNIQRLSMKHYHTDALVSKKPKPQKNENCVHNPLMKSISSVEDREDVKVGEQGSRRRKKSIQNEEKSKAVEEVEGSELDTTLQHEALQQQQRMSNVDDLEDEWKYRQEKRRSKDIGKSRIERRSVRKSRLSIGPVNLGGPMSRKSHKPSLDYGQATANSHPATDDQIHHPKRYSRKRDCRETMRRRKSIHNKKLIALQKAQDLHFNVENPDEEEFKENEEALPEFKYEFSDLSLTKMKYGAKMRQEMEKVIIDTKLPINLEWPLAIKGFDDYFKRKNPYGKVIYTMRLESQVRQARKISRKYKYVLHNYNYQIQQYHVLKEVHESNMKHLEISKQKWEFLVEDLFTRVIQELRDYSQIAFDSSGKRIPRVQVDRFCKEIAKSFEAFQYTVRIFYRVVHNVGMAIRHLCYSESHGEGVELFEFKHLLRTNETIGAQHIQKKETLKGYKQRTKRFVSIYQKQLTTKEDIEVSVTDKFRLSGEISCMMTPKQNAVKSFEITAKKILKKETGLRRKSGIVPYRHLIIDYEDTFMTIAEKRQLRRDFQLKYNSRVREVHEIFDKMEEIERKMPELFIEPQQDPIILDACGHQVENILLRPKTAPPSSTPSRRLPTITSTLTVPLPTIIEPKASKPTLFFSPSQSRHLLEVHANRPSTAAPSFAPSSRPKASLTNVNRQLPDVPDPYKETPVKSMSSLSLETRSSLPPIRPSTAIPEVRKSIRKLSFRTEDATPLVDTVISTRGSLADQVLSKTAVVGDKRSSVLETKRPSTAGDKRLSTGDKRISTFGKRIGSTDDKRLSAVNENLRNSRYSKMIADEHADIAAAAKRKTQALMRPTAAKTGIVPMITKKNMLTIAKSRHSGPSGGKNFQFRSTHQKSSSMRPSTAPISPYESEVKHWPYQYYSKPSPQLENTSKRRMDVVLGNLVHQPRPLSLG